MVFNLMETRTYGLYGPNSVKHLYPNPQLTMCQTVNVFSINSNYKYTDIVPFRRANIRTPCSTTSTIIIDGEYFASKYVAYQQSKQSCNAPNTSIACIVNRPKSMQIKWTGNSFGLKVSYRKRWMHQWITI